MAKNIVKIGEPKIDNREERPYLGIRIQTPFRGMFKQVDLISKELNKWFKAHDVEADNPPFLRYHVIDMNGEMDIEYGIPVKTPHSGDERVRSGNLPAGRYASLIYSGSGLQGNKALIEWVRANNLRFDRWDDDKGDAFRSRYEAYLTDPKIEPRKTKWDVEVAFKLTDE